MEKLRDQLATGDVDTVAPRCATKSDVPKCVNDGAAFFVDAAKFDGDNPDQASAATAALLVFDGHGSWLGDSEAVWLAAEKTGKGDGGDALRLAIGRRLADSLPALARKLETDDDGRKLLGIVAADVPGACVTYESLASTNDDSKMDPAQSADHSSCVQKDLVRVDGPGGAYGYGLWRAVAAGLALLKDTVRALDVGAKLMTGKSQTAINQSIDAIKHAIDKIEVRKVDRPEGDRWLEGDHTTGGAKPLK